VNHNDNYNCIYCLRPIIKWLYRYQGKYYCRACYESNFKLTKCTKCNNNKRIHIHSKDSICKICQVKDKPCIRCGKTKYTFGKITHFGPICNSCSKYYKKQNHCTKCNKQHYTVSNRTLNDGGKEQLCQSCYHKKLPKCSLCGYYKLAFVCNLIDNSSICKKCYVEAPRKCKQCDKKISAGTGRTCRDCRDKNRLLKKEELAKIILSKESCDIFTKFIDYLIQKQGTNRVLLKIQNYIDNFIKFDNLYVKLNRYPTYKEYITWFGSAASRKNSAISIFLDKINIIKIDDVAKKEYANIDAINKCIDNLTANKFYPIFKYYLDISNNRYKTNIIKLSTLKANISTASNFFIYCNKNPNNTKITQVLLNSYLWIYPGQAISIMNLIAFINSTYNLNLTVKYSTKPKLVRTKESKKYLKIQLQNLLAKSEPFSIYDQKRLYKLSFAYFYYIKLSNNIVFEKKVFKRGKIYIAKEKFYFPKHIYTLLLKYAI